MDKIELKAETRNNKGNGPARVLRREGRLPAVLYGPNTEPCMLSIAAYDLEMVLKQGNIGRAILNLTIEGQPAKSTMVKELQQHPVTGEFLHLDLYEIDMARKIRVNVPVTTTGKSKGIEMGGMLHIVRRELEVLCLPDAIPGTISVDITDLDIGDSVHVGDLKFEGDVEVPHEVNFTILTITSAKTAAEEEAAGEGEEVEEEAAQASEEA